MKILTFSLSVALLLLAATGTIAIAQNGDAATVAAITKIENDGVKADLANDKSFYEKLIAPDWTETDSDGHWYTKADVMKLYDDPAGNKMNTETISNLKVRVYGDTAIATYSDTYDGLVKGEHRVRTIASTDVFVKIGGDWKEVASQGTKVSGK
jgi:hypothetical protein